MKKIGFTLILSHVLAFANIAEGRFLIPPFNKSLVKYEPLISKGKMDNRFSLLVWNVHKGKDKLNWIRDMQLLTRASDVVLLQEATDNPLMSNMFQKIINNFSWFLAKSFIYIDSGIASGVSSASAYDIDETILHRTDDREPIVNTPKTVILTYMTMANGDPIAFLNIHGLNRTTNAAFFRQIDETLNLIKDFSGPVVYAGDFNTNNKSKFNKLEERMAAYGLKRIAYEDDNRKHQLDWIYTRGCEVESSEILYHIKTSDHDPLYAKLNCRKN